MCVWTCLLGAHFCRAISSGRDNLEEENILTCVDLLAKAPSVFTIYNMFFFCLVLSTLISLLQVRDLETSKHRN